MTSKVNKAFGKVMDSRVEALVKGATVHKDTHHITYALPEELTEKQDFKFKNNLEVVQHAVDLVNGYGLAVEAATTQIAHDQFADTKVERWDGHLKAFDGLTFNSDVRLREVIGEDTIYGAAETFIDHPHSVDMVTWYSDFAAVNEERAKKLFD